VQFFWYPRWIAVLALPALLVAAILATIMTRRAEGELPFTPRAYWRWKLGNAGFVLSVLAACIALPVAIYGMVSEQTPVVLGSALVGIPLPIAAYVLLVWRHSVSVAEIRADAVVLKIPSQKAAEAWRAKVRAGVTGLMPAVAKALAAEAAGTTPAPVDARCATHAQERAVWACGRCGSFFCEACAVRPEPGAQPMCAACVKSRTSSLAGLTPRPPLLERLQMIGLVLGLLSLVPGCLPAFLIGAPVNVAALVMTLRTPDRWRLYLPLSGAVLNLVGLVIWALMLADSLHSR
jgi:hypothetical protein